MIMKFFAIAALSLTFAVPAVSQTNGTILDIVIGSVDHTSLEDAVSAASPSVKDALSDSGNSLTLFAPDDSAFESLGADVDRLLSEPWRPHLDCVLLGHVHGESVNSSVIGESPVTVDSLTAGYDLTLVLDDTGAPTVNGAPITGPDLMATNGVVHSISEVLLPDCVTVSLLDQLNATGSFTELLGLLSLAPEILTFGDVINPDGATIFAPNDDAFAKIDPADLDFLIKGNSTDEIRSVLFHHVTLNNFIPTESETITMFSGEELVITVGGGTIMAGDATVKSTILARNGIVHEIDSVLIPPSVADILPSSERTNETSSSFSMVFGTLTAATTFVWLFL